MHSYDSSRQSFGARQEGVALIVTLMIMMLVSALMVGFVAAVVADQRASGLDRDQTQAYAAAHAGMEQLSSDLSNLFISDFSPSGAQLATLRATPPSLPGFTFVAPGGGTNSGYWVEPKYPDASGNPLPENITEGSMITVGPYQGFKGIITPYDITITARSTGSGGAEVRMKRTLQTVAIPVFQFGMFSETDLAFHAGAEAFTFGGRVHTNGNLFLAAATGGSLTIADRITAVGEVVRTNLPNGLAVGTGYTGTVRIPTTIASNPVNNVYRNLLANEGSLTGTIPKTTSPNNENPTWYGLSTGTYKSIIRNGTTGAKTLALPLVADLDNNGVPDARPIDLIRRPAQNSNENTGTLAQRSVYQQRFFALASVRILLSDTAAEILSLPTVTPTQPVPLFVTDPVLDPSETDYSPVTATSTLPRSPIGTYETAGTASGSLPGYIYKGNHNDPVMGGFIKIEIQRQPAVGAGPTEGVWQDVTAEVLGLGISGRNIADANEAAATRWNKLPNTAQTAAIPGGTGDICAEPHPFAIVRLQRVRDVPAGSIVPLVNGPCGVDTDQAGEITTSNANNPVPGGIVNVSSNEHDYWPMTLYDTREAGFRDGHADNTDLNLLGIMHYVELDMNNLRRWLAGQFAAAPYGAPSGPLAKNDNGYILYFSDRRNNKNGAAPAVETGELGFEDVSNPGVAGGAPNGAMDSLSPGCQATHADGEQVRCLEDFNDNHTLDLYGRDARPPNPSGAAPNTPAWPAQLTFPCLPQEGWANGKGWPNPLHSGARITDVITDASIGIGLPQQTTQASQDCNVEVPLTVPGGGTNWKALVARANRTPFFRRALKIVNGALGQLPNGITVTSENPVYVQGNYNSNGDFVTAGNVPAAVIADAVTLLSNNWNDLRSFNSPWDSDGRRATTTSYRMAVVTGKGIPFPQPAGTSASFGSDGGAHNFVRSLEDWDTQANPGTVEHRYRGSMVSFFINRQAVGTFKCCNADAYNRGDRAWTFDTDFLLPTRLPPGTPMFRDVNTLTFRQLLRPTQ
jgi:hypothetical protein